MLLPPHFRMALYAKERVSGKGEHVIVLRTMGPVTAGTVHGNIRVPRVFNVNPDRMRRMLLILVAFGTHLDVAAFPEEVAIVRSVGRMA